MANIKQSVIYNGRIYYANQVPVDTDNRAFLYGDSIFETIFASDMRIPFLEQHLERLQKAACSLQYILPPRFSDLNAFTDEILRLLNRNKHYKGARVRLNVFRKSGGLYTPENNGANYLIETKALKQNYYPFDSKGIKIAFFDETLS